MSETVLGVDPGASGALVKVLLNGNLAPTILTVLDMPVVHDRSWALVDGAMVLDWFERELKPDRIVMERVDARPTDGKGSSAAFARLTGGIASVLLATGAPLRFVTPAEWKRRAGLLGASTKTEAKRLALDKARLTFGTVVTSHWLAKAKDQNRAEAALIAIDQGGAR